MIVLCPFCGQKIGKPLEFGSASCNHCDGLFRTGFEHEALSAAQLVRRRNADAYQLLETYRVPPEAVNFVEKYVIEMGYSHDELLKEIKLREKAT